MTPPTDAVEPRVIALVADAAGVSAAEIAPATPLTSIGMGSLERLECVLNIEDAFEVELEESDLRRLQTVGELVTAVEDAIRRRSRA